MNNKLLLGIFVGLLLIYGASKMFSGKKETSFKTELIEIDSASVSKIEISPKGGDAFVLQKTGEEWLATQDGLSVKANQATVGSMLSSLKKVKTKHIAAKSKDKWESYEVDEANASKIKLSSGDKALQSFYVGRFSFNQQARTATSYLRLEGEEEVYAVDGFQGMAFNRTFEDFRNKQLARTTPEVEFTSVTINYGDRNLDLAKTPQGWTSGEVLLDSMKVENYLNQFRNLSGENFADDFDPAMSSSLPKQSVTLQGNNLVAPIEITVFEDASRTAPYLIVSSINPDSYFSSDSSGLYSKIIKPEDSFLE
jgi:hypothetical protein